MYKYIYIYSYTNTEYIKLNGTAYPSSPLLFYINQTQQNETY